MSTLGRLQVRVLPARVQRKRSLPGSGSMDEFGYLATQRAVVG
jgi:hypothetical protein